jgi:GT2 family glycosyltransferase
MATNTNTLLSIIIVSYNTAKLTAQTLSSIKQSLAASPNLKDKTEILVVDNNSSDDSITAINAFKNKFTHFQLIQNKDNKGFAGANNQAAKRATGRYLLLLNSDTIVQNTALETLVSTAQKENLSVAAAQLLNTDLSIQPQGGSLPTLFHLTNHFFFIDDLPFIGKYFPSTQSTGLHFTQQSKIDTNTDQITPMGWVGGTAMLISHALWEKIGPLDEHIFMYGEDIEFCMRAWKADASIGIVSNAHIIHLGSASSSSENAILGEIKGYLYIWKKHKPAWQLPLVKLILIKGIILRIFIFSWLLRDKRGKIYKEALELF